MHHGFAGLSGGPVLIADTKTDGPKEDLVVGIVSYANYSSLEESGIAFVKVSEVRAWIDSIVTPQVSNLTNESPCSICLLLSSAIFIENLYSLWLFSLLRPGGD